MLDVALLAPVDEREPAADARIDFSAYDLAVLGGEQPSRGKFGVEPGIEDAQNANKTKGSER